MNEPSAFAIFAPRGAQPDLRSAAQLEACLRDERAVRGALMADHHLGYCVPLDTEILTRRGWLGPDEVQVGDETIGFDQRIGMSAWTKITSLHRSRSRVFRIGHSRWSARVTARHRWWADRRNAPRDGRITGFVETRQINSETRLILSRPFVGGDSILSPQEAALIAWLLCDGTIGRSRATRAPGAKGKRKRQEPRFEAIVYQSKPAGRDALELVLAEVPHRRWERTREGGNWPSAEYRIDPAYMRALWCRAALDDLSYGEFVCTLSREALNAFMGAAYGAEGTDNDGQRRIAQKPGELCDALILGAYLAGDRPTVCHGDGCDDIGLCRPYVAGNFVGIEELSEQDVWCVTTACGSWTMRQDNQIMLTGNSMPIGGVVAYDGAVSPSGVGFDIACGNKAAKTDVRADDLAPDLPGIMERIQAEVAFGLGRSNPTPVDHELFDRHAETLMKLDAMAGSSRHGLLSEKARAQLGTVGSGNHYVDLLADEDGWVWAANHFGSRGLGHTIAAGFLNLAAGQPFDARGREREEPTVIPTDTELGQFYLAAMELAGDYAYAGRDLVLGQVLGILGARRVRVLHNHHNYAWLEDGLWVVRKGATPLTREEAFVGGSMGEGAAIVRGRSTVDLFDFAGPLGAHRASLDRSGVVDVGALGSAPHGAGRVMSRTAAAGKARRVKVWACPDRECGHEVPAREMTAEARCPEHPDRRLERVTRLERKTAGVVDWPAVQRGIHARGIVLRGGGADEAPEVYKPLGAVLDAHPNVEVMHRLRPLGVVMAGDDVFDPYKD